MHWNKCPLNEQIRIDIEKCKRHWCVILWQTVDDENSEDWDSKYFRFVFIEMLMMRRWQLYKGIVKNINVTYKSDDRNYN